MPRSLSWPSDRGAYRKKRHSNRAGRGIKAGLIRPITLFPFPEQVITKAAEQVARVLVVEMNLGQMVEDVRLAVNGRVPVSFYGRPGGALVVVEDVATADQKRCGEDNGKG